MTKSPEMMFWNVRPYSSSGLLNSLYLNVIDVEYSVCHRLSSYIYMKNCFEKHVCTLSNHKISTLVC